MSPYLSLFLAQQLLEEWDGSTCLKQRYCVGGHTSTELEEPTCCSGLLARVASYMLSLIFGFVWDFIGMKLPIFLQCLRDEALLDEGKSAF